MGVTYYIGLDLGKAQDYTAWAAMEHRTLSWNRKTEEYVLHPEDYTDSQINYENSIEELGLIGLSQVPLHTPWATVAKELDGLIDRCLQAEKRAEVQVWIDASGLGDPVIDGFIEPVIKEHEDEVRRCTMYPVRIVPGEGAYDFDTKTVSKVHLIDNAMVMREKEEFVIASGLKDRPVMALFEKEIQDFRRKEGKRAGTIRYEAIEGEHDDLVLSFALACLGASHRSRAGSIYDFFTVG